MKTQFAQRIANARKMAGYSMDQLASLSGLSKNAISRYENGIMKPDSSNLIRLAKALNVKVDYFFRKSGVELQEVAFRKKAKLGTKCIDSIKYRVIDRVERYLELEDILAINNQFVNPIEKLPIIQEQDIEAAALQIRTVWNIGQNSIPSVIEMLEDNHIKVVEVDESLEFDGLSSMIDNKIPVIVVNRNFPVERKRFTLLHELGYLLMNVQNNFSDKEKEKMCHRFAGSFLVPQNKLIAELGNKRGRFLIEELIVIQKEWGISIAAIMLRSKDLEIINQERLKEFYINCNMNPALKDRVEASRYAMQEESIRFNQLLYKGIAQELVSLSKASALSNHSLNEIKTTLNYI